MTCLASVVTMRLGTNAMTPMASTKTHAFGSPSLQHINAQKCYGSPLGTTTSHHQRPFTSSAQLDDVLKNTIPFHKRHLEANNIVEVNNDDCTASPRTATANKTSVGVIASDIATSPNVTSSKNFKSSSHSKFTCSTSFTTATNTLCKFINPAACYQTVCSSDTIPRERFVLPF